MLEGKDNELVNSILLSQDAMKMLEYLENKYPYL